MSLDRKQRVFVESGWGIERLIIRIDRFLVEYEVSSGFETSGSGESRESSQPNFEKIFSSDSEAGDCSSKEQSWLGMGFSAISLGKCKEL